MIIEKLTEVIKFTEKYGEDYDTQLTLQWINPKLVYIKNLTGSFSKSKWSQVETYLASEGVEKVMFCRYKNGEMRERELPCGNGQIQDKT